MILDGYDVDLMKIIGWCKNAPAVMNNYFASPVFSPAVISSLTSAGLAYEDEKNGSYRLRPAGYRLLHSTGYDFHKDAKQRSEEDVVARRCVSALILSTFYRAGINSFAGDKDALRQEQIYLPTFALRRGRNNIANSTVMRGVYRGHDTAYMVFSTRDYSDKIHFNNELKTFNQVTERAGASRKAVNIMGDSYKSMADINTDIFNNTSLPVHLIPIGDTGAFVIKVLQIPGYRDIIAKAVLRGSYRPPYKGMPDTDTVHFEKPHYPAVIAVDMDIKRIDRAYETARKQGFERIVLYVLTTQTHFVSARYADTNKAELLFIEVKSLSST